MGAGVPMTDLIDRKRRGEALGAGEIEALIAGYTAGAVPDYQMAALLMAILWRGMTDAESTALTLAMAHSGAMLDLSAVGPVIADKHSTGGVGDKTTLVVAPLVAAGGVPVGKMSGRGLGHTGGTIDKLESITGFSATLDAARFVAILRAHGLVLAGQSAELAPADGLLYALRDVTATVQSIPLIASSIMSKKLAAGATHILLDVKVGRGAFMTTRAEAEALARLMVAIGQQSGRRTRAVLSAMDQPLGRAVGNALEVAEAIATLSGEGPADFTALCLHEAGTLLALAGAAPDADAGEQLATDLLRSGRGLATFRAMIVAQGGDGRQIDEPVRLPTAPVTRPVPSPAAGHVADLDALAVGRLVMRLGGGRQRKGDTIDPRVGVFLHAKVGDRVAPGKSLATIHATDEEDARAATVALLAAYTITDEAVAAPPLILGEVG